jgi:aquaporin Z
MTGTLRRHWPEYGMEAALLGAFMLSACAVTTLLEHPASPARAALPDPTLRRGLTGAAMGLTAIALIYSPWGKQSGAHMNPSVSLAFCRLGKVRPLDALCYVLAQFAGAILGVLLAGLLLRGLPADPAVRYAVTVPGPAGAAVAFAAELAIAFGMMTLVLTLSSHKTLAPRTGFFAGGLVALYILFEAPLSGMSMNPARTLGSALAARSWEALWIYFTAPPLGMLAAAEVYRRRGGLVRCAKLHHHNPYRCIFCGTRFGVNSGTS